ncbi:hypothetical protein FO522_26505 [Bacillus nitratireducens]|nr:hypothetical protein [Bacillus nitratireducens]
MMFPPKDFVTLFTLQIVIFRTPLNIKNHGKETFPMVFGIEKGSQIAPFSHVYQKWVKRLLSFNSYYAIVKKGHTYPVNNYIMKNRTTKIDII